MWKIFQSERSVNKIFSLSWYPSNTGLYGVIAKLTADENFSREARLKKICSIFALLGMFVMLVLFHLSLGDGQCSWNLNIIKAFQGPLPKKLETSRAKVQTLRKGGGKNPGANNLFDRLKDLQLLEVILRGISCGDYWLRATHSSMLTIKASVHISSFWYQIWTHLQKKFKSGKTEQMLAKKPISKRLKCSIIEKPFSTFLFNDIKKIFL